MAAPKVMVADPQRLFAESLAAGLRARSDFEVIDEHPGSGPAAYEAVMRLRPDVALLDYWMPEVDGPTCVQMIRTAGGHCRILLVSGLNAPHYIDRAFAAGAVAFIPRSSKLDEVVEAVRRASQLETRILTNNLKRLARRIEESGDLGEQWRERLSTLTPREVQILGLLNRGLKRAEIAQLLVISPDTVRTHIGKILKKAGASSQGEVLSWARRSGVLWG